jgi:glycosyltransferase involved in cell wall biosynthesis
MNKKILVVTEYFYPEEFKINEIVLEWQKKGYQVEVLTNFPTYPAGKIFENYQNRWYYKDDYEGVTVHRIKSVTGYKESLIKKLLKYFVFMTIGSFFAVRYGKKYDYIFGFNMAALTGMVPAVLIKKLYKKPLTFWAQDIWPDSVYAYGFKKTKILAFFLERFVGFMYRNIDAIAISGKGFESKLKPYIRNKVQFYYLPNWADDLNMNLEAAKFSIEKKVHFTFAGNVGKVQNLDNIIKAFNGLDKRYRQKSQLNIVGDGSALEELKSLNEENNVVFHGRKPRDEMAKYYKASDFLIVSLVDKPIFSVTVPAKTQTYIAAKKPILGIINGDTAEIIEENNLGYVASPSSVDEIKKIFMKAIDSDEKELSSFTQNCMKLTENTFNKEVIIEKLLDLTVKYK